MCLFIVGRIFAEKEELDRVKLSKVHLDNGSKYIAAIDVFHQLHCLVLDKSSQYMKALAYLN